MSPHDQLQMLIHELQNLFIGEVMRKEFVTLANEYQAKITCMPVCGAVPVFVDC